MGHPGRPSRVVERLAGHANGHPGKSRNHPEIKQRPCLSLQTITSYRKSIAGDPLDPKRSMDLSWLIPTEPDCGRSRSLSAVRPEQVFQKWDTWILHAILGGKLSYGLAMLGSTWMETAASAPWSSSASFVHRTACRGHVLAPLSLLRQEPNLTEQDVTWLWRLADSDQDGQVVLHEREP